MIGVISHHRSKIAAGAGLGLYAAIIVAVPHLQTKVALCTPLIAVPLAWYTFAAPNRWLTLFFLSALLLPPLPVALGNSGPHLAVLFAAAGMWIGLLHPRAWRIRADALAVSLLALFGSCALSIPLAAAYSGLDIAAASLARLFLLGISIYVFFFVRDGLGEAGWTLLRVLFWAACASALFACIDFYYQFPAPGGYGPQFVWLDSGVFRRAQGFFYEASTLGNLCAFFLEMIAVVLFGPRAQRPAPALALLAGGSVLCAALVLSYSRASLVNLCGAIVVLLWLHRKRFRFARMMVAGVALAALSAVVLWSVFPVFTAAYSLRLTQSLRYFSESPNAVLSGRLANWSALADFLISHPWHAVLGVGFKTLPYSNFAGAAIPADNTYLSTLAETGIGGLLALLAVNAAILWKAYRASQSSEPLRSLCGAWIFCFWCGQVVQMFSADLLTYWRTLPVYFCVLAIADRAGDEDSIPRSVQ